MNFKGGDSPKVPGKTIPFSSTCEFQFSSVAQSCLTLCDPVDCSMPGFPVCHQLPELAQTHVHWVSDTTQPSHPLLFPSPPVFNLSQHQGLFQWVSYSHQVVKVLELQHLMNILISNEYSGLISFRIDWFDLLAAQGNLKVFSSTIIQRPFQYCKILHSTLLGPLIMLILSFQINFINYS